LTASTEAAILSAAWPTWIPSTIRNPATRLLDEDLDLYDQADDFDLQFGEIFFRN